jgi:hypothetical protein
LYATVLFLPEKGTPPGYEFRYTFRMPRMPGNTSEIKIHDSQDRLPMAKVWLCDDSPQETADQALQWFETALKAIEDNDPAILAGIAIMHGLMERLCRQQ